MQIPRCEKWVKESCLDVYDDMSCGAAMDFCTNELEVPFFTTGLSSYIAWALQSSHIYLLGKNPYDISSDCEGDIADTLCYPVTKCIQYLLWRLVPQLNDLPQKHLSLLEPTKRPQTPWRRFLPRRQLELLQQFGGHSVRPNP